MNRYREMRDRLLLEQEQRRRAIGVIVTASELIGSHGVHLPVEEVDAMPEKVFQALLTLNVDPDELKEFYEGATS